jgi:hypothetical protein
MAIDGTPNPTERLVVAHAAMACGRLWNGHSRLISTPDPQDLTIAPER